MYEDKSAPTFTDTVATDVAGDELATCQRGLVEFAVLRYSICNTSTNECECINVR